MSNVSFSYYSPTKILFGKGIVVEKIVDEVTKLGSRALFVSTNNARVAKMLGYYDKIISALRENDIYVVEFTKIESNPSIETCIKGAEYAKKNSIDVIIGFGGGSAIDAAKAIAAGASITLDINKLLYPNIIDKDVIPIIAIPTTCGTGSEITKYSILTDKNHLKKVVLAGPGIIPKVALIDPYTLTTLPNNLITWTALDAFSHALESYISKNNTPISDIFALESMKKIVDYIVLAVKSKDIKYLSELHLASTLAGLAINVTGTTIIHALGYYLTTRYGIHHGLANALFIPIVMSDLLESISDNRLKRILNYLEVKSIDDLVRIICNIYMECGMPGGLSEFNISYSDLDKIVVEALSSKRNITATPFDVSRDYVEEVVKKAYRGWRSICT